jgi:hypothetical protein
MYTKTLLPSLRRKTMENKYCPPYLNKQIKHFVGGGNCGALHNGCSLLVILWLPMLMTTITVLCGYSAVIKSLNITVARESTPLSNYMDLLGTRFLTT